MYSMTDKNALLYKQKTYPQHQRGKFFVDSIIRPESKERVYRVLYEGLEGWVMVKEYLHLKNAVQRAAYEQNRLEKGKAIS